MKHFVVKFGFAEIHELCVSAVTLGERIYV
jgi:hypothetical protein